MSSVSLEQNLITDHKQHFSINNEETESLTDNIFNERDIIEAMKDIAINSVQMKFQQMKKGKKSLQIITTGNSMEKIPEHGDYP